MHTKQDFPPVFADPAIEGNFTRDGYVVLPFFDEAEVAACRKLYFNTMTESLVKSFTRKGDTTDFFTTAFLPDGEPRRKVRSGLEDVIAPHVPTLMPTYTPRVLHFLVKGGRPDAGFMPLHQDFTLVDNSIHRSVHVWIPLADVNERNGCLTVVPGSHRLAANHISAMGLHAAPYDPYRQALDDCKVGVPMRAGDAFFFDERTLHGSYPNSSPDVRIAMGAVFLPKHVKQLLYVADEAKSAILDVVEVESENLMDCSTNLRPPYPEGFRKIGTFEYIMKTLRPEVVQGFRRSAATQAIPAASLGKKQHFFSRVFGRLAGSPNAAP